MPTLTKKIGPLPTWAWGAIAVGFVVVVVYLRRGSGGDSSAVAISPPDEGMIAGPDGSEFTGLTGTGVGNLGNGSGGGGGDTGYYYPPDGGGYFPGPYYPVSPYEQTPITHEPDEPSSGGTAVKVAAPAPTKQTSFVWDGKTYTRSDLPAFRAWLKAHGQNYATWASNHPKAAQEVFGTMK